MTLNNLFPLLVALLPGGLLMFAAWWHFKVTGTYAAVPVVSGAIGVALCVAAVLMASTYVVATFSSLRSSVALIGIPAACYVALLMLLGRKGRLSPMRVAAWGLIGLLPLCLLSFLGVLWSACSFGDCV